MNTSAFLKKSFFLKIVSKILSIYFVGHIYRLMVLSSFVILACPVLVAAKNGKTETEVVKTSPVLFEAQELSYDQETQTIVASGKVRFAQNGRILNADQVTFERQKNRVIASGNVRLTQPNGDVAVSEYVELTSDLKSGVIKHIGIALSHGARLVADSGQLSEDGQRTQLNKAVFSTCVLCPAGSDGFPLWQIRANEIIHDRAAQQIEYYHATMDFLGVPILYSPYISHADPAVKRRSGFLIPNVSVDKFQGFFAETPYFWAIRPTTDITIAPRITTDQGVLAVGEFRHRFSFGEMQFFGSTTLEKRPVEEDNDDTKEAFRNNLFGKGMFSIDENWRAGFDVQLTSDDTYLRAFNFTNDVLLKNQAFAEGFYGKSYVRGDIIHFDNIRNVPDNDPLVLPLIGWDYAAEPWSIDDQLKPVFWGIKGDVRSLFRYGDTTTKTDDQLITMTPYFRWANALSWGLLVTLEGDAKTDFYVINDFVDPNGQEQNGGQAFFHPQAGLDLRYPLIKTFETSSLLLEPVAGIIFAPSGPSRVTVPDEDSSGFELDDTNIFTMSRLPGEDLVENGVRTFYGLKGSYFHQGGSNASWLVAQNYNAAEDTLFFNAQDEPEHFSDIVGYVSVYPVQYFDAAFRFVLDKDNLQFLRAEFQGSAGVPAFRVTGVYTSVNQQLMITPEPAVEPEELTMGLSSQITKYWRIEGTSKYDFVNDTFPQQTAAIHYDDECFGTSLEFKYREADDLDIQDDAIVMLMFRVKGFGQTESIQFRPFGL